MLKDIFRLLQSSGEWAITARPVAEIPTKVYDDLSGFLGKLCGPGGEELGLLFRDKIKAWRMINLARTFCKVEEMIGAKEIGKEKVSPRVIAAIADPASYCEDDTLQSMWAGLIAGSRCTDGKEDHNLIFIDILEALSVFQARLVNALYDNESFSMGDTKRLRQHGATVLASPLGEEGIGCLSLALGTVLSLHPQFGTLDKELESLHKEAEMKTSSNIHTTVAAVNTLFIYVEITSITGKSLLKTPDLNQPEDIASSQLRFMPTYFGESFHDACQGKCPSAFEYVQIEK